MLEEDIFSFFSNEKLKTLDGNKVHFYNSSFYSARTSCSVLHWWMNCTIMKLYSAAHSGVIIAAPAIFRRCVNTMELLFRRKKCVKESLCLLYFYVHNSQWKAVPAYTANCTENRTTWMMLARQNGIKIIK